MNIKEIMTSVLNKIKSYADTSLGKVSVNADWNSNDTYAEIKNKPTTMTADGGNADTVSTYHLWSGTKAEYQAQHINSDTIYFIYNVEELSLTELSLVSTSISGSKGSYKIQWGVKNPLNESITYKLYVNGTATTITPTVSGSTCTYTGSNLTLDTSYSIYILATGKTSGVTSKTNTISVKIQDATSSATLVNGYYTTEMDLPATFTASNYDLSTKICTVRSLVPTSTSTVIINIYSNGNVNLSSNISSAYLCFWNNSKLWISSEILTTYQITESTPTHLQYTINKDWSSTEYDIEYFSLMLHFGTSGDWKGSCSCVIETY